MDVLAGDKFAYSVASSIALPGEHAVDANEEELAAV